MENESKSQISQDKSYLIHKLQLKCVQTVWDYRIVMITSEWNAVLFSVVLAQVTCVSTWRRTRLWALPSSSPGCPTRAFRGRTKRPCATSRPRALLCDATHGADVPAWHSHALHPRMKKRKMRKRPLNQVCSIRRRVTKARASCRPTRWAETAHWAPTRIRSPRHSVCRPSARRWPRAPALSSWTMRAGKKRRFSTETHAAACTFYARYCA